MNQKISIYTDGSCIGNPGPGGWAAVFVDNKGEIIDHVSGGEEYSTNNRMEISAIIEALRYIKKNYVNIKSLEINIFSDSNLVVQTMNRGWKKKMNLDLWLKLDEEIKNTNVNFFWVKAHHTDINNQRADQIARAEAEKRMKL